MLTKENKRFYSQQTKFLTAKNQNKQRSKIVVQNVPDTDLLKEANKDERGLWLVSNSVLRDSAIPWPGGPEAFVSREGKIVFENALFLKYCLSENNSSLWFWFHFYLGILGIYLMFKSLSHNPLDLQPILMYSSHLATWCL